MGVDTRAAIFVGLPRNEIKHDDLQDWIDAGEISVCPPYYDGYGADHAIVGWELAGCECYAPSEFLYDAAASQTLKERFKELTGQDAKVWLSPYVF
jgi:hypothetical protein